MMTPPRGDASTGSTCSFFEKAERERRWNVFDDIPWDKVRQATRPRSSRSAPRRSARVEMYLPDYVAGGHQRRAQVLRPGVVPGQLGLRGVEALARADASTCFAAGKRTDEQMFDLQNADLRQEVGPALLDRAPDDASTACVQEMATFVIYVKHRERAPPRTTSCSRTIYDFIARDEIAHFRFYASVKVLLEEDREGTPPTSRTCSATSRCRRRPRARLR